MKCIWGPNLEILPSICGDLLAGQAQNGVNFDFEVQFDLEGQGQLPYKTIGILTKVFYTYGPNLVILAWMDDELLCGQASDYRTHGRTDTQTDAGNDNTRRPKLASGKKVIKKTVKTDIIISMKFSLTNIIFQLILTVNWSNLDWNRNNLLSRSSLCNQKLMIWNAMEKMFIKEIVV